MTLRLAILGCGAVTELNYLPALMDFAHFQPTLLVDTNIQRAKRLADQYKIPQVLKDLDDIYGKADAAILALPHHLHSSVAIHLLQHGIHVLVEKPMALTVEECQHMIEASQESHAVIAVGLVRRFYPASLFVKELLDTKFLGELNSFDVQEGFIYNWPVASDFLFRRDLAGGGVLIDTGSHTLDLVLWWLGDYATVQYKDDTFGGVEANCVLRLHLTSGLKGTVELSRMRNLRNTVRIYAEKGLLEIGCQFPSSISLHLPSGKLLLEGDVKRAMQLQQTSFLTVVRRQLDDFAHAILDGTSPFVSSTDAIHSIRLIQDCYQHRQDLELPWLRHSTTVQ